jgi:glycerol-3-phosphate dehydrogenase (NAD(P)+)
MNKERITVLGAGSWGATLATLLCEKGFSVGLWEFDPAAARSLATTRQLPVLPALKVPPAVHISADLVEILRNRPLVVVATPSQFVRSTVRAVRARRAAASDALWVSAAKGLEENSLKRMSEVIAEEGEIPMERIGVLSGPSHAEEVCEHLPTAAVVASVEPAVSAQIQRVFMHDYFRVYTHPDLIGVELGGTLKNIYAIACGISDGLGLGDNTRAAILTRGLNEMTRLGVRLGAQLLTFFGLAGVGDLIVTALSKHSRNRAFGEKIGRGKTPEQALSEMTMVTEGYKTTRAAQALAEKLQLECPLTREVHRVLFEGKKPLTSLHDLMARESQTEWRDLEPQGMVR